MHYTLGQPDQGRLPSHIAVISHRCAAHCALGRLLDAARHALVAAHVRQTSLEQYAPKGAPKVLVENRIDGRIEGGVHVAEPECNRERNVRYVAHRARGLRNVQDEERQPARNETAHDQAEDQRGALLLLARNATFLLFGIARLWHFGQGRLQFGQFDVLL